ncbi:hypothetical protein [Paraburkholderia solisilvae]|uniref:Fe2OG dioxygenase domain-containing protein n=1 Tax=Paraburkholderia solisilvae TaxID=624376 RepID=A0A6J5DI54_9BURK|nr:hypothetical protein [Paraburkholderia solisilvae]CAB3753889.1 hypothetical protein LMG29739_01816 [Paraburkholderia solisilvae]
MLERDGEIVPPGVRLFEGVVPRALIAQINAAIDETRDTWRPADGRRATQTTALVVELLRQHSEFRSVEQQARTLSERWAAQKGLKIDGEPLYVLRCINRTLPAQSHLRHYDSHILTLLIPLQSAHNAEENGDLIVYRRPRHQLSAVTNVMAKSWLIALRRLPLAMRRAQTRRDLSRQRCDRIACVPGNVYAFNGFVTRHANLHVEQGERRTLIVHYFDPGMTAGLRVVPRIWRSIRDLLLDAR